MEKYVDYLSKKNSYTFNKNKILKWQEKKLNITSKFRDLFPKFTLMLKSATLLEIFTKDRKKEINYWVLCWEIKGHIFEIVCLPPKKENFIEVEPYTIFMSMLGGILEFYYELSIGEGEFYWQNKTKILGFDELDSKEYLEDIRYELEQYGKEEFGRNTEYIDLEALFIVDLEANGDVTLCDRNTEKIYLFAHDNSSDYTQRCQGYPEYTFYTLNKCRTLVEWIETLGAQWLNVINSENQVS
ncbi:MULTISPECIES: hypothetical protein [unclassified Enterococcus]|uniref:hypothetical protein n=1 Tax=unclassified Enterococcus TaxID=2608891 RepID=UPI001CE0D187|nr:MULTISPECIES: hypothetical protein [unclassified Enterococcus]MCA5013054.1 hypothetical protein [Enterococcus sp. S23]MCA5016304.1 hypothetical protein [Enterococcus sp. S22(2020)]